MVWNATDDADSYVRATAVHVIGSLVCRSQLWISLLQISHLTEVLSKRNRGNKQARRNRNPALPRKEKNSWAELFKAGLR